MGEREKWRDGEIVDFQQLREASQKLELPMIAALCSDRYLLSQMQALKQKNPTVATSSSSTENVARSSNCGASSKNTYPVSSLSATKITKPPRKSSTNMHKHPVVVKGNAYEVTNTAGVPSGKKDPTRASY